MPHKTYYAIHGDGIYTDWFDEVKPRTNGKNATFKAFSRREDAETFMGFARARDAENVGLTYSQRARDSARRRGQPKPEPAQARPRASSFFNDQNDNNDNADGVHNTPPSTPESPASTPPVPTLRESPPSAPRKPLGL